MFPANKTCQVLEALEWSKGNARLEIFCFVNKSFSDPTFTISTLKIDVRTVGLVFSITNYFILTKYFLNFLLIYFPCFFSKKVF